MKFMYQSNGFIALQERGFAEQTIIIPAPVDSPPHNTSDRLLALDLDAPIFFDSANKRYSVSDGSATRCVEYYADRTVYHVAFNDGPTVSIIAYPIYDQSGAVVRIKVEKAEGSLLAVLGVRGTGFQALPVTDKR